MPGINDMPIDMVPADMVVNCAIAAAHKLGVEKPKEVQVFNLASSTVNPVTMGQFFGGSSVTATKYPLGKNKLFIESREIILIF